MVMYAEVMSGGGMKCVLALQSTHMSSISIGKRYHTRCYEICTRGNISEQICHALS